MRGALYLVFFFILSFFTSCVTTHETSYLQQPKHGVQSYKDSVAYKDYKLKPGDKLMIQVYSTDDKTNTLFNGSQNSSMLLSGGTNESVDLYVYTVDDEGKIVLPLIGTVDVIGKSLRDTKFLLEDSLKSVLPLNSVDVRLFGKCFSIIGAGKSGRFYMLKEKINIFEALSQFGDFGFYANRSKVKILRVDEQGKTQIKSFDIRSVDIINSDFFYIEPNDVIYVEPMYAQFFGATSLWTAISTVLTTYTLGYGIYIFIRGS
jgi:polysaccharide biosynthesis/export protein